LVVLPGSGNALAQALGKHLGIGQAGQGIKIDRVLQPPGHFLFVALTEGDGGGEVVHRRLEDLQQGQAGLRQLAAEQQDGAVAGHWQAQENPLRAARRQ